MDTPVSVRDSLLSASRYDESSACGSGGPTAWHSHGSVSQSLPPRSYSCPAAAPSLSHMPSVVPTSTQHRHRIARTTASNGCHLKHAHKHSAHMAFVMPPSQGCKNRGF